MAERGAVAGAPNRRSVFTLTKCCGPLPISGWRSLIGGRDFRALGRRDRLEAVAAAAAAVDMGAASTSPRKSWPAVPPVLWEVVTLGESEVVVAFEANSSLDAAARRQRVRRVAASP
jgi:hypothetical protein